MKQNNGDGLFSIVVGHTNDSKSEGRGPKERAPPRAETDTGTLSLLLTATVCPFQGLKGRFIGLSMYPEP